MHSSLNIWIKGIVGLAWVLIAMTTLPMKVSLTVEISTLTQALVQHRWIKDSTFESIGDIYPHL